jgi:beta-N-acetylhexosaminidase
MVCHAMKNVLSILVLLLAPCIASGQSRSAIEREINAMTDEERIGQLLFLGLSGPVPNAELREVVGEWHAGGIALYAHNIESREQVRRLNEAIVLAAEGHAVPFIAIDQEGGIVHRLRLGVPVVPSNMALGAAHSADLARRAGFVVGAGLRELGFTMNFAPVLDVLSDPRNTAIGTRAFSDNPELTATLGAAFIEGEQRAGVIAVGKHFPGQGGVAEDTHTVLPRLTLTLPALRRRELVPFDRAFKSGLLAVMSSHIAIPLIAERPDLPATLSRRVMTNLLRNEMHFQGIAISDALQMDALARRRDPGALAIDAILAGSDMVLMLGSAKERQEVFRTLLAAYRDGRLPKQRVREALRRTLKVKASLDGPRDTRVEEGAAVVQEIARKAVTLAPRSARLIPIPPVLRQHAVYIGPDGVLRSQIGATVTVLLPSPLRAETENGLHASASAALATASIILAAATNEQEFKFVRALHKEHPSMPFVFVNLGSPFRLIVGESAATLLHYAEDEASQAAAVAAVNGQMQVTGRLPVDLEGLLNTKKAQGGIRRSEHGLGIVAEPTANDRCVDRSEVDAARKVSVFETSEVGRFAPKSSAHALPENKDDARLAVVGSETRVLGGATAELRPSKK